MKRTIAGLLVGLAALLALPASGEAQQAPKIARLGVLLFGTPDSEANMPAFRQRLAELGWVEGKTLATIYRFAEGQPERLPALAGALAALKQKTAKAIGVMMPSSLLLQATHVLE